MFPRHSAPAEGTTIFRDIQVKGGSVWLGQPIPDSVRGDLTEVDPTHYDFKPGTFGTALDISLVLDDAGNVQQMLFDYDEGQNTYEGLVSDFTAELGEPAGHSDAPGNQWTQWEDSQTSFQIDWNGTTLSSTLTDLA